MFTQYFFIEGQHAGQATRQKPFIGHYVGEILSYGFYCEACGEVYARAPAVNTVGKNSSWLYYRLLCRRCPTDRTLVVPGSIYLAWDSEFVAAFPDAVLRWEYDRHLEWYERGNSNAE